MKRQHTDVSYAKSARVGEYYATLFVGVALKIDSTIGAFAVAAYRRLLLLPGIAVAGNAMAGQVAWRR